MKRNGFRIWMGVVLSFAVGGLLLSPQTLSALPTSEVEIFYFDGNGQVAGYFFRGCDGQRIFWGNTSLTTTMRYTDSCNVYQPGLACWTSGFHSSCGTSPFFQQCVLHYDPQLCS